MKTALTIFFMLFWVVTCHGVESVTLRDHKVNIHLVNGSLLETLETLQKKSGVEFVVKKSLEKDRITIDLKQEKLEQAVNKLLKNYNKNSEYSKSGKLKKVYVLSRQTRTSSTAHADEPDKSSTEVTDGLTATQSGSPPEKHEEMEVIPAHENDDIPGKVEENVGEMEVFESSEPGPGS
jgi:type II secretory pathway component GspD/PulD (secretin)